MMARALILEKIRKELARFRNRRLAFILGGTRLKAGKLLGSRHDGPHVRFKPLHIVAPERATMVQAYEASGSSGLEDTFVLYRIIGSDLPPRHRKGQTRENIRFILDHEPAFAACEKRWIVNRIYDEEAERDIIDLLESANQPYLHIPFDLDDYRQIAWDGSNLPDYDFLFPARKSKRTKDVIQRMNLALRRRKNLYVMNNNGARNTALADGRGRAKWVLPFDGNCFFTQSGFEQLREAIHSAPWVPYFIVPMARITGNENLKDPGFITEATEEPQIVFRTDAGENFDGQVPYGRRPKVNLLWRLGVPGPWNKYRFDPWDIQQPVPSSHAGQFESAGWVARLESGRSDLESGREGFINRGMERGKAVIAAIDELDARALKFPSDPLELAYYDADKLNALHRERPATAYHLLNYAEDALNRGPFSVIQKTAVAPSGDPHDYFHPAPYWWPNPATPDGLPYVQKDGERVPGTTVFGANHETYDRTRLQYLFNNTTALALAGTAFKRDDYLEHAAKLIRTWFIVPNTRMNPHLAYSQVRLGHNDNLGTGTGIIEFKDIYFFLDAVRLVVRSGHFSSADLQAFKSWLADYLAWLQSSPAAQREFSARNNHGTYFEVQLASLARFLEDRACLAGVLNRAKLRFFDQLDPECAQPAELKRTRPRHYTAFNLSGWFTLARVLEGVGGDLWYASDASGRSLPQAVDWLIGAHTDDIFKDSKIDTFKHERLVPIWWEARARIPAAEDRLATQSRRCRHVLHPDYGIPPFWTLAQMPVSPEREFPGTERRSGKTGGSQPAVTSPAAGPGTHDGRDPDFICFGAQKAATDWLFDQMNARKDVWVPPVKELGFFTGECLNDSNRHIVESGAGHFPHFPRTEDEARAKAFLSQFSTYGPENDCLAWYRRLFALCDDRKTGYACPGYSKLPDVVIRHISSSLPDTRFIFLVREPISRFWSNLCMHVRMGLITENDLYKWSRVETQLTTGRPSQTSFQSQIWRRWLAEIEPDRIQFWFFDDVVARPAETRDDICNFLGIAPGAGGIPADFNRKAQLQQFAMPQNIRVQLNEAFADELAHCAEIFGGHAVRWRDTANADNALRDTD